MGFQEALEGLIEAPGSLKRFQRGFQEFQYCYRCFREFENGMNLGT